MARAGPGQVRGPPGGLDQTLLREIAGAGIGDMAVHPGFHHDAALQADGVVFREVIADGTPIGLFLDETQADPISLGLDPGQCPVNIECGDFRKKADREVHVSLLE
ncbi:ABC transporter component [Methylocaldum marinum]|uniref:ABC transporter component n=1 Tax=Methylocaldum marinum TaxID=1432792 RepID=A0A250KQ97_9GAMM|nr:ABC transporter component [Methylocaldum marinum]